MKSAETAAAFPTQECGEGGEEGPPAVKLVHWRRGRGLTSRVCGID
jgi:hypothetical protein